MPRSPKPPGTKIPAQSASFSAVLSTVSSLLSTQRMSTCAPQAVPAWNSASTTLR